VSWKSLCIATCALMLTACASSPTPSPAPALQASLREPCPDLAPPQDGSRASMLRWSVNTARAYRECQSRHRRTVEAFPKE
jgi:hypothetical protein